MTAGVGAPVALVVAGMHRSGTSAVTRLLVLLGCDGVRDVISPDRFNERGYWEAADVAALNDEVLAAMGSTWDGWAPHARTWDDLPGRPAFDARADALLTRHFAGSRLFVLKDPRICRLLPFWRDALGRFGAEVRVVLPVRDPVEVAASLLHRNLLNPSISQLIWLRHVLEAEAGSRGLRRAVVGFRDVHRDWRPVVDHLSAALDLRWPVPVEEVADRIDGFLTPTLRHHDIRDGKGVDRVARLPSALLDEAQSILEAGDPAPPGLDRLDRLRRSFDEASGLFRQPVHEIESHARRLKARLDEVEGRSEVERASLRSEVAEARAQAAAAQARLAAEEAANSALRTDLGNAARLVDLAQRQTRTLNDRIAEGDSHILTLRTLLGESQRVQAASALELDAVREHIGAMERSVAELTGAQEAARSRLQDMERAQMDLTLSLEESEGRRRADGARLRRTEEKFARLSKAATDRVRDGKTKLARLEAVHEQTKRRLDERSRQLSEARQVADEIVGSASWRLTAPYRRARRWLGARRPGRGSVGPLED